MYGLALRFTCIKSGQTCHIKASAGGCQECVTAQAEDNQQLLSLNCIKKDTKIHDTSPKQPFAVFHVSLS